MEQPRKIYSKFRKFEYFLKKDPLLTVHIIASILRVLKILQGYVLA